MDEKQKEIYNDLKKIDDIQMKLKLSIPFINLLGINFETELDVKNWFKRMYKKFKVQLFKLSGMLFYFVFSIKNLSVNRETG
jgi:hypothetical protein